MDFFFKKKNLIGLLVMYYGVQFCVFMSSEYMLVCQCLLCFPLFLKNSGLFDFFILFYLAVVTYLFSNKGKGMEVVGGEVERIWDKLREGKP